MSFTWVVLLCLVCSSCSLPTPTNSNEDLTFDIAQESSVPERSPTILLGINPQFNHETDVVRNTDELVPQVDRSAVESPGEDTNEENLAGEISTIVSEIVNTTNNRTVLNVLSLSVKSSSNLTDEPNVTGVIVDETEKSSRNSTDGSNHSNHISNDTLLGLSSSLVESLEGVNQLAVEHLAPLHETGSFLNPAEEFNPFNAEIPLLEGGDLGLENNFGTASWICPVLAELERFIFPDPFDNKYFYKCSHGIGHRFQCPGGLVFNPIHLVCDWRSSLTKAVE